MTISNVPIFSTGPQTLPATYVNSVQMNASPWDFSFDFRQLGVIAPGEDGTPAQVAIQASVRLLMSPQHAKAFHRILEDTLTKWQEQFGELPELDPNATHTEVKE